MSLSCFMLRSLNRPLLSIKPYRYLYTTSLSNAYVSPPKLASAVCETHMQKNERLKRPLSPHLSIYKLELTSTLSVTHRATGIILASYAVILSVAGLVGGVDSLVAAIDGWCLPPAFLYLGKYAFCLPVTFHFFNGIRHLLWDLGKFLTIKEVYSTGYTVVGLSIISALVLAAM